MCYVSAMLGGRSGNRGLCAQPCRLNWRSGSKEYALSLKDMSLLPYLSKLAEIGVDSFKIEGRMKRAEYVAAAVTACKNALSGNDYDETVLRSVFSRSGFTDGYLAGKRNAEMYGYRTKEDVVSASDAVFKRLSSLYAKEKQLVPVLMDISIDRQESFLTVTDERGNRISVSGPGSEPAVSKPMASEDVIRSVSKLGDTPYVLSAINVRIPENQFISVSALNQMRRDAVRQLSEIRSLHKVQEIPYDFQDLSFEEKSRSPIPQRWARITSKNQIDAVKIFDRIIIPAYLIDNDTVNSLGPKRIMIEIPAVQFPDTEDNLTEMIMELKAKGLTTLYANNLYGLELANRLGIQVVGGFGLNAVNTHSLKAFADLGINEITTSFELTVGKFQNLGHPLAVGLVVYGRLPLMRFRNCPVKATIGCSKCGAHGKMTDRFGISFPVECNQRLSSTLLNSVPVCLSDQEIPTADHHLFWFTDEENSQIEEVNRLFQTRMKPSFNRTTGLYFREVL